MEKKQEEREDKMKKFFLLIVALMFFGCSEPQPQPKMLTLHYERNNQNETIQFSEEDLRSFWVCKDYLHSERRDEVLFEVGTFELSVNAESSEIGFVNQDDKIKYATYLQSGLEKEWAWGNVLIM